MVRWERPGGGVLFRASDPRPLTFLAYTQGTVWDTTSCVASIGDTRKFAFKTPDGDASDRHEFFVFDGDVIHMFGDCNTGVGSRRWVTLLTPCHVQWGPYMFPSCLFVTPRWPSFRGQWSSVGPQPTSIGPRLLLVGHSWWTAGNVCRLLLSAAPLVVCSGSLGSSWPATHSATVTETQQVGTGFWCRAKRVAQIARGTCRLMPLAATLALLKKWVDGVGLGCNWERPLPFEGKFQWVGGGEHCGRTWGLAYTIRLGKGALLVRTPVPTSTPTPKDGFCMQ